MPRGGLWQANSISGVPIIQSSLCVGLQGHHGGIGRTNTVEVCPEGFVAFGDDPQRVVQLRRGDLIAFEDLEEAA
jgi:hypothetical protein